MPLLRGCFPGFFHVGARFLPFFLCFPFPRQVPTGNDHKRLSPQFEFAVFRNGQVAENLMLVLVHGTSVYGNKRTFWHLMIYDRHVTLAAFAGSGFI